MFTGKRKTPFSGIIARRNPFQGGGLSDPFDMFEKQYGVGLEILKVLHKMKYPICFSTKGTWILEDDRYAQLFHNNSFWNVKVSIINMDDEKAKLMERGVASPEKRLDFMKRLVALQGKNGGGVTLRLRPFIIGYTNENNAHVELIRQAASVGCTAVTTEFLCIEGRLAPETQLRYAEMSEIMGFDMLDFYKKNTVNPAGYMRLNWKIKQKYVDEMQAACKIRFYVSDAHHKDRSCNGCCCGLPESWTYHRGQYTNALVIAKKKGWVAWSDIENDIFPELAEQNIVSACGLNIGRGTASQRARFQNLSIKDYIKMMWNDPNQGHSPYKYFYGLLKPLKLDNDKNIIYQYVSYS
jgi:DNA repair photolyase